MEKQVSVKSIAFPLGLGLALYSIAVLIIMYVMNIVEQNWMVGILNFAVSVAIIGIAINKFKKGNSGFITLGQALKVGMATIAIAAVISAIYMFVHYSYVAPEAIEMMKEAQEKQMMEMGGQISEEQREQSKKMMDMMMSPFFITTIAMITSIFFGFIISLVIGLIVQKKRPENSF